MTDRYDAMSARKYEQNGETKTAYTRIGTAFKNRSGDGYTVRLEAMPAPTDGQFTILLFPPKPRDESRGNGGGSQFRQGGYSGGGYVGADDSDNIPFAPPRD